MSTLSSSSTLAEVEAAYDDNASYAEDGSAAKAAAFITACRILLRRSLKRVAYGGTRSAEMEWDPQNLREQIKAAQTWLASSASALTGGGVKYTDLSSFRDF